MRYVASNLFETYESESLPMTFGKWYEPNGQVTITPRSALSNGGVDFVELEGETLAIHADTASWAFLSPRELQIFRGLRNRSVADMLSDWPDEERLAVAFVATLYRRGLLTIDGRRAVDPTIFDDSPNVEEGHLVELLVTEKCNLGCVYCLAGTNPKMPRMTPEVARKTIDLAFAMDEARVLAFEFSGGEPFLEYRLMRDLVSYIQSHPRRDSRTVYINIQTNCTLLDEERVDWLAANDIRVGISVDGNPESHNVSRPMVSGRESFSKLINGIDLLQRKSVPFGALVVLNRHNVDSAEDLAHFLVDNGIVGFKLNPVAFLGTARGNWSEVGLRDDEVVSYFKDLLGIISTRGYPLLEDNVRTMCEFLVSKRRATRCLRSHCGAGDTFQAVAANGDIYPCGRSTQSPALRLGNVMQPQIISLSEPGRFSEVIEQIRNRRPRTLEGCVVCEYRQLCQAGCSAQAFERYGTVRHRTPECTFYKTMYPFLMRWLSFDVPALRTLEGLRYFGEGGVSLMNHDFVAQLRGRLN